MKNKLFTIGLPLAMAVCIFIGCASTGGGGGGGGSEPGSLTITGIPSEYNGKFASFSYDTGSRKIRLTASASDPRKLLVGKIEGGVITNGAVKLLLFKEMPVVGLIAYTDSDTLPVELCIRNTAESPQAPNAFGGDIEPDFIFESVTFKDGVAEVKWDDPIKAGSITVTGIPAQYSGLEGCNAIVMIGFTQQSLSNVDSPARGGVIFDSEDMKQVGGNVKNGTATMKIYRGKSASNYMSYTFTGTKDIMVALDNGKEKPTAVIQIGNVDKSDPSKDFFLFKDAQITDGKINLDFRQGVKQ